MTMPIERFRKKPIIVDTILWDGTLDCLVDIVHWIGRDRLPSGDQPVLYNELSGMRVWNEHEQQYINVPIGHRVVRGACGEHYPISPEAVAETYEAVED